MRILLYVSLLLAFTNCSQNVNPPPTARKSVSAMPGMVPKNSLKYIDMRNLLVNQTKIDDMQRKIFAVSSAQSRKYLQMSLDQLQKKLKATPVDYQRLLRRIETTRKIELLAYDDLEVEDRTPSGGNTRHYRDRGAPVKQVIPPPKSITISMPGSALGTVPAPNQEVISTKTGASYPHFPQVNPKGGAMKQMKSPGRPK